MGFEVSGEIRDPDTIAEGTSVKERERLEEAYGKGRWRKRKGVARVLLLSDEVRVAEVHWYEARGIGRRELKIKRLLA